MSAASCCPLTVRTTGGDQTALLQCQFTGVPDQIAWFRGTQQLRSTEDSYGNRITQNRVVDPNIGVITSQLVINRVTSDDVGLYKCVGSNAQGQHHSFVTLTDSSSDFDVILTPAPPVLDVPKCCEDSGVTEECRVACTAELDFSRILDELANPLECIDQLPILAACGADGKDHTGCCASKGVPSACHAFCLGIVPELDNEHLLCLAHFDVIGDCMREGSEILPSAPANLRGSLLQGAISLQWRVPDKQPERVQFYDVHYEAEDVGVANHTVTLNSSVLAFRIRGVRTFATYHVYVVSRNEFGASQPSNVITMRTFEHYPGPPQNLRGAVLEANPSSIRLSWDVPLQNYDAVTHYIVYYGADGTNGHTFQEVNSSGLSYLLQGLQVQTEFTLFVSAASNHHKSLHSNTIVVTTGGK